MYYVDSVASPYTRSFVTVTGAEWSPGGEWWQRNGAAQHHRPSETYRRHLLTDPRHWLRRYSIVAGLVVEFEDRVDGEIGPATLLEHDEGLDGAQRCRTARRRPRGGSAASAATLLLSAGLLLHLTHYKLKQFTHIIHTALYSMQHLAEPTSIVCDSRDQSESSQHRKRAQSK
ncbi:unnamed protein product [Chrysodeixis includens]|uniref:Uncharacterized protein n=1 Tax=Chrysodeixis includens TaxID=689277 RepID=A0A9N8PWK7_CHRIL|nr:unnamed protein product [Chrysodeixis includens]